MPIFVICLLLFSVTGFGQVSSTDTGLGVRNAHAMTYNAKEKSVYLFGGADEARVLNDLWVLEKNRWRLITPVATPHARTFANLIYDPSTDRLILFGGSKILFGTGDEKDVLLNDTWEFRDGDWFPITTQSAPCPRAEAAMVYDEIRKRAVLFGGYTIDNGEYIKLSDTWEFYGDQWHLISDLGPSGRHGAAMIYDRKRKVVLLFGGSTIDRQYGSGTGETWSWDGERWNKEYTPQPTGIFSAAASLDDEHHFIRFGGWDGTNRINETWRLTEKGWLLIESNNPPSPRNHSGMVFDSHMGRVVLFGGHDGTHVFGDTWAFSRNKWTKLIDSRPKQRIENGH